MKTINEQEILNDYLHTNMRLYEINKKHGTSNFTLYKIFKKHNVRRYKNLNYKLSYPDGRGTYSKDKYFNAPAIHVRSDGIVVACGIDIAPEEQPKMLWSEYLKHTKMLYY